MENCLIRLWALKTNIVYMKSRLHLPPVQTPFKYPFSTIVLFKYINYSYSVCIFYLRLGVLQLLWSTRVFVLDRETSQLHMDLFLGDVHFRNFQDVWFCGSRVTSAWNPLCVNACVCSCMCEWWNIVKRSSLDVYESSHLTHTKFTWLSVFQWITLWRKT